MIIQVPHSFADIFHKEHKGYHFEMQELCNKLKEIDSIQIKHPIYKVKFYLNGIAMRWFIAKKSETTIVPLYFIQKSSREWQNLVLDQATAAKINSLLATYQIDFVQGNYSTY
jgi:hypothetical protein